MVVPATNDVRYGVPVGNTTGSATLTPLDVLNYAVQNLTGSNSIGARLQNISTVQTTAATIAAFKGK
jgi:metallophosphoesterase superfamily enzyme